ncbi:MAG TPA: hypothetical protein VJL90_15995 [Pseudorhodoplanes sp.]|nr:hypothetical protein [Pseudorhodoplanes sp.]
MSPQGRKFCLTCLTTAIVSLPIIAGFAVAQSYPVTGKWTYEDTGGDGPAKECGKRYMDFRGERRFDTGGGVPDYRNRSVTQDGDSYTLVDEFDTGQISARLNYNIRRVDNDRIELKLPANKTVKLRRCE